MSLNVERVFDENLRLNYTLWEEKVTPILVLEVVSTKPGGEYTTKLQEYARLGVLYYRTGSIPIEIVSDNLRQTSTDR